jgi:RHS repeat-associated protein
VQTYGGNLYLLFGDSSNHDPYVYFQGHHLWAPGNTMPGQVEDRVGTVAAAGSSYPYYPYGEPRGTGTGQYATYLGGSNNLFYAMNRWYSSQVARFTSPDPYVASGGAAEPQSWNRYVYVQGDPVNSNDPSGRFRNIVGGCGDLLNGQPQDGCDGGAGDNDSGSASTCLQDSMGLSFEPNPMCSAYQPPPRRAKPKPDCPAQFQNWIDLYDDDAVATGLSEANVLALSSIESGWGNGRFAQGGNSFFNLERLAPKGWKPGDPLPKTIFANQLSWMNALEPFASGPNAGRYALVATYKNPSDAFESFAATDGRFFWRCNGSGDVRQNRRGPRDIRWQGSGIPKQRENLSRLPHGPKPMTKTISLIIMLLVASPVVLALDPTISTVAATELVREALASLGEGSALTKIAIYPWLYYWAPDFITLQAEVPHPDVGKIEMRYFAVNPWTGDVWDAMGCARITSPTIKRKQDEIWKSSKLPDEARQVLQARAPACTPGKPEPREKKK